MKKLKDIDVKNKRVLVRVDFNVPLDDKGNVLDDFRIKKTLPTIEYLIKQNAKVILISHLGRPEGRDIEYSLRPVAIKLEKLLGQPVRFLDDCIGQKVQEQVEQINPGEIFFLENLRFYKQEKENDREFGKVLANLADVYINDALAVSHRAHASVVGIPVFLPSATGLLLEKEIATLSQIIKSPKRPLISIIGGVKISTKVSLIEKLLEQSDHVLVGGIVANIILGAKGICLTGVFPEKEVAEAVEKVDLTSSKLHLPVDGLIALKTLEEDYVRQAGIGTIRKEENAFDIGPETIKMFSQIIKQAKTIFWSGPLGHFEDKRFAKGSLAIAQAIFESNAFSLAGGGETINFLGKHNLRDKFDYISTGGGAMLSFLGGKKLPGLEVLK